MYVVGDHRPTDALESVGGARFTSSGLACRGARLGSRVALGLAGRSTGESAVGGAGGAFDLGIQRAGTRSSESHVRRQGGPRLGKPGPFSCPATVSRPALPREGERLLFVEFVRPQGAAALVDGHAPDQFVDQPGERLSREASGRDGFRCHVRDDHHACAPVLTGRRVVGDRATRLRATAQWTTKVSPFVFDLPSHGGDLAILPACFTTTGARVLGFVLRRAFISGTRLLAGQRCMTDHHDSSVTFEFRHGADDPSYRTGVLAVGFPRSGHPEIPSRAVWLTALQSRRRVSPRNRYRQGDTSFSTSGGVPWGGIGGRRFPSAGSLPWGTAVLAGESGSVGGVVTVKRTSTARFCDTPRPPRFRQRQVTLRVGGCRGRDPRGTPRPGRARAGAARTPRRGPDHHSGGRARLPRAGWPGCEAGQGVGPAPR